MCGRGPEAVLHQPREFLQRPVALQACPRRGASEAAPWLVQPKIHLLWAFTMPLAELDLENKKTNSRKAQYQKTNQKNTMCS